MESEFGKMGGGGKKKNKDFPQKKIKNKFNLYQEK
jgi:hypothetical protein